jgi:hypothetical protein
VQPPSTLPQLRGTTYDQYEISISITTMADCWEALLESAYGGDVTGASANK